MKHLKIIALILIAFASFAVVSCDNEPIDNAINLEDFNDDGNDDGGNNGSNPGTFKVDFDGQTFVATTTQAIVNEDYIAITGLRSSAGDFFQLTIPNGTVGTYTWSDFEGTSDVLAMAYHNPTLGGSGYVGASDDEGEFANVTSYVDTAEIKIISINSANNTISGTFKFTGIRFGGAGGTTVQTKVFTNGQFNLTYVENTTSPTNNSFTAKLNGVNFVPTNINGYKSSGIINLIGRRGNVENIGIFLPENVVPGTYDIEFGGAYSANYVLDNSGTNIFGGDPGTITITSHDIANKKIVGTFSFEATNFFSPTVYDITNGAFNITYQ